MSNTRNHYRVSKAWTGFNVESKTTGEQLGPYFDWATAMKVANALARAKAQMPIDYAWLDRWVEWIQDIDGIHGSCPCGCEDSPPPPWAYEAAEAITNLAPVLARELLALRGEIERTRDRITDELERTPAELQAAKITLHTERVHMLGLCAHLLSGDYE